MKKIILLFAIALLVAAGSSTASGKKLPHTCWQAKITFINYSSTVSAFAHWRLVQRGHTYAEGEFAFKGDYGGFYQRVISRCVIGINPLRWVSIKLKVLLYVDCPECKQVIALRRTR
jgi:hypothetical protein